MSIHQALNEIMKCDKEFDLDHYFETDLPMKFELPPYPTIINYEQQNLDFPDIQSNTPQVDELFCNCHKTGCLKLYCSCFRRGVVCGQNCFCQECHNSHGDELLPLARDRILLVHNHEVGAKVFTGCKCKRSKCKQKYCECLIRNLKCGESCQCKKCQNGQLNQQRPARIKQNPYNIEEKS